MRGSDSSNPVESRIVPAADVEVLFDVVLEVVGADDADVEVVVDVVVEVVEVVVGFGGVVVEDVVVGFGAADVVDDEGAGVTAAPPKATTRRPSAANDQPIAPERLAQRDPFDPAKNWLEPSASPLATSLTDPAERQEVFFRRIEGVRPLTDDAIIARHKFWSIKNLAYASLELPVNSDGVVVTEENAASAPEPAAAP